MFSLTPEQNELVHLPLNTTVFLEGLAGSGKTTAAVQRILHLISNGIPAQHILILVPQRTLAQPYQQALSDPQLKPGGTVNILTIGGLARRLVEFFWQLVAGEAGFLQPEVPPTFLTLETAQYFMSKLVRPRLEKGYFASLSINPNRLYSQILDNLNKAAIIGRPHTEISQSLKSAWSGNPGQMRVYDDVQECAIAFRQFCFEHNLLDFSLQIEIFRSYLLSNPTCWSYLHNQYHYLIAENIEEDVPISHDFIRQWLPDLDSTLLVFDRGGGYRTFLGSDPVSACSLKTICQRTFQFEGTFINDLDFQNLIEIFQDSLNETPPSLPKTNLHTRFQTINQRFYPQVLDAITERIHDLVHQQGIPPQEIVVLAPYFNDSLRFALTKRLEDAHIPVRSHRPSRALREEPLIRAMLTLATLAHPLWDEMPPINKFDLAYTFFQIFAELDLVRAQLLVNSIFTEQNQEIQLASFEKIPPKNQERITFQIGERYEQFRLWLRDYVNQPSPELEIFLIRLFDELLTQPGFRFSQNERAGELVANLIESVQKFRRSMPLNFDLSPDECGQEYIRMVQEGVIAAQYLRSWQMEQTNTVLLAPAYTFLMTNHAVDVQIWLDIGSSGWYERLFQPLTHPYVLSRNWQSGKIWTADDEEKVSQQNLDRIVLGLLRRCRRMVWIGYSELGESGFEQRGQLLRAAQRTLETINQGVPNG